MAIDVSLIGEVIDKSDRGLMAASSPCKFQTLAKHISRSRKEWKVRETYSETMKRIRVARGLPVVAEDDTGQAAESR